MYSGIDNNNIQGYNNYNPSNYDYNYSYNCNNYGYENYNYNNANNNYNQQYNYNNNYNQQYNYNNNYNQQYNYNNGYNQQYNYNNSNNQQYNYNNDYNQQIYPKYNNYSNPNQNYKIEDYNNYNDFQYKKTLSGNIDSKKITQNEKKNIVPKYKRYNSGLEIKNKYENNQKQNIIPKNKITPKINNNKNLENNTLFQNRDYQPTNNITQNDTLFQNRDYQQTNNIIEKQNVGNSLNLPGNVNIHRHILTKENLSNIECNSCNKFITGNFSCCKKCKLFICENCSKNLFNNYKKNDNCHNHPLTLELRPYILCDVCGKNFTKHSSFYCKICDFDCCYDCYTKKPSINNDTRGIESYFHPHELMNCYYSNRDKKCDVCLEIINGNGFECKPCNINLCQKCSNAVLNNKKKYLFHPHPLLMIKNRSNKPYKCDLCEKSELLFGFTCKICNMTICGNCYCSTK